MPQRQNVDLDAPRKIPPPQDAEVYLGYVRMAKYSREDPARFISLCKHDKIKDIRRFKGHEATNNAIIMLNSGRQIASTLEWNPLTFALVNNESHVL